MAGWKLRKDKSQAETPDEASPAPTSLTEATPENHVPALELTDDLLPLPSTHWEMPMDDWTPPAAPAIAEPITEESVSMKPVTATPVEDEPVFAEEVQHKQLLHEEAQPEEIHYHFAPLELGAHEPADTLPQFEEDEEDLEPAPKFDDDEPLPAVVGFSEVVPAPAEPEVIAASEPVVLATSEPVAPAIPEPEVVAAPTAAPEPEVPAASEPEIVDEPEPAASPEPVISLPETEVAATPEPEVAAPPVITEPIVVAAPEPEVIAAPPVVQEPQAVAAPLPAPVPPAALAAPLFPIPAPPEIASSTLRLDRSELASAIPPPSGFSVPSVSPFLLDVPAAPVQETPHTLLVRIGRLSATFEMTKEVTVIGRPDSELHFYPDIEIEMDDAVSRRHAEILRHEEEYYLVDAGSTNGTLLNGEMLTPHEERKLAHGDRIHVGERTEIIFE